MTNKDYKKSLAWIFWNYISFYIFLALIIMAIWMPSNNWKYFLNAVLVFVISVFCNIYIKKNNEEPR